MLIVGFVDWHRRAYGVESIRRALRAHATRVVPRTYRKALNVLGVTERTARTRFSGETGELPLLIELDDT